jgi:hypothetical protein
MLSEIKGDEAFDVLVDMIDPISEIIADEEIKKARTEGVSKLKLGRLLLKNHRGAVKTIIRALGDDPNEVSVISLPINILKLLNDPEITRLFTSLQSSGDMKSSSAVQEE